MTAVIKIFIDIFKIPELRKRVLWTLFMLLIFRVGFHIYLPGIKIPVFPKTFAARPDLETGMRLLAMATEGGILLTLSGPPPEGQRPVPPLGGVPGVPRRDVSGRRP